jgi:hypothetical protein
MVPVSAIATAHPVITPSSASSAVMSRGRWTSSGTGVPGQSSQTGAIAAGTTTRRAWRAVGAAATVPARAAGEQRCTVAL